MVRFSRELRHNQTDAEERLWWLLRSRRLANAKFDPNAKVDLVYLDNCDHGGFLWMKHHCKSVVDGIERLAS